MSASSLRLATRERLPQSPSFGPRLTDERVVAVAAAVALAVAAGVAVGRGAAAPAAAVLATLIALAIGIANWRLSVIALLVYIPVSGLLTIALHPHTAPGVLAKDALFVIPAYVGWLGRWALGRPRVKVPGMPVAALTLLAVLVLVQAFNSSVPSALVAAIGVKTWLLYIPLLVLGYELIRDRHDLERILLIMAAGALIPCIVGLVEAGLIYAGKAGTVYGWYGSAASAASQDFAEVIVGPTLLHRVPSTFSYATQFYSFTAAMAAVAYATWRCVLAPRGKGLWGIGLLLLIVAASMLTGTRSALALVPALVLAAVVLDAGAHGRVRRAAGSVLVLGVGLFGVSLVLGSEVRPLLGGVAAHGSEQLQIVFVDGLRHAFDATTLGLGTGVDTIASRYAVPRHQLFQVVGGTWQESWWVKALLELGIAGLVLVAVLMTTILIRALRITLRLADPGLRATAAAITAYLLWGVVSNFKAQNLDLDPMNVYFWLFIGILLRLPALDRQPIPVARSARPG